MRFLLSALAALAVSVRAAIPEHLISSLPGYSGTLPSKQYSGYISVDDTNGRYLHYWFVESEGSPSTDPLILWLNGGPGCSSLDGLLYENGPLLFDPTTSNATIPSLVYNPYTWSKLANVLYLEAPAGVGFSYSNTQSDYTTDDSKTAADNYQFLLKFYESYPEFNNTLFIAGESYAGVYVPTLADAVRVGNAAGNPKIPLEGIAVGNGCTGNEIGVCGGGADATSINVEYLYGHDLYSADTYKAIKSNCGDYSNPSSACYQALDDMSTEIDNVNIYNIYDDCINGGLLEHPRRPASISSFFRSHGLPQSRGPAECIDGIASFGYLNNAQVQSALHVQPHPSSNEWHICTSNIRYSSTTANLPRDTYPTLIKNYRVLIFNGDADACVPVTDNSAWTASLNLPVTTAWRAWLVDSQVAGYVTEYSDNFAFLTVKGAGHMVPEYKPKQAFQMIQRFLANQDW